MRNLSRSVALWLIVGSLLLAVVPANARHRRDPHTRNLRPTSHTNDNRPVESFSDPFFTDLAFKRNLAYQGTWSGGFRVIDISPGRPRVLSEVECGEAQGDIGVYRNLVFRSIDSPVTAETPEQTCTGEPSDGAGFEGIQIFDVDDPANASADDLVSVVGTDCGSHTHTVVPDKIHNRVLLYVSNSNVSPEYSETVFGNECDENHGKFQVIEVPLDAPEDARVIRDVKLGPPDEDPISLDCHDIGVLKSNGRKLAVCAGDASIVYDISRAGGAKPRYINSFTALGVGGWHSAALSWDGSVTVMGWEPGGGVAPECEEDDRDLEKSVFFFDTFTGEQLGTWVLPRGQSEVENCTIHNYNVVPTLKRNVLVMGNYQAGTWVVDFTNPRHARTVAWSDPRPADPEHLTLAGAWGSYWYNGRIFETNITEGVNIFRLRSGLARTAKRRHFLNPQTQYGPLR